MDRVLAMLDEGDTRENYVLSTARTVFHGGYTCVDCGGSGVLRDARGQLVDCPSCDGGEIR